MSEKRKRPAGFALLSLFFWFGVAASGLSFVSLMFPGSFLEPIWQLNPRAREGFASMGGWAAILMFVVCGVCATAAIGLWRNTRWGYWTAVVMLIGNLIGDIVNVTLGIEPKAAIGIPIASAILVYLYSSRSRVN